jgi:putative transposase
MAQRTQINTHEDGTPFMQAAYDCLLENGLDGAGQALRILVDEASKIERAQYLQAKPYERSAQNSLGSFIITLILPIQ